MFQLTTRVELVDRQETPTGLGVGLYQARAKARKAMNIIVTLAASIFLYIASRTPEKAFWQGIPYHDQLRRKKRSHSMRYHQHPTEVNRM